MAELPIAPVGRLLKNAGANRISDDAKIELANVLEEIGMVVTGDRTLAKFAVRGVVKSEDGLLRIPRELVKWALEVVPKEVTLYGTDGNPRMIIDKTNRVYFGTHNDMAQIVDYKTNKARPMLLKDIATMCKVASNCENIDFVLSVGLMADVDSRIQSQMAFISLPNIWRKRSISRPMM